MTRQHILPGGGGGENDRIKDLFYQSLSYEIHDIKATALNDRKGKNGSACSTLPGYFYHGAA